MGDLSEHFDRAEFRCRCGCGAAIVSPDLPKLLEVIRERFGKPIKINSGYRCPSHNERVGGATRSEHCRGTAADIVVEGVPPSQVYEFCDDFNQNGGVGSYASWTHVDVRGYKARWKG